MSGRGGARPRLVLHVGQHKTGSKAIQSFCFARRDELARAGVCYPRAPTRPGEPIAYTRSHYRLYAAVRRDTETVGREPEDSTARALFASFEEERRRSGAAQVLLSAEDLLDMATAHELALSPARVEEGARALAEHAAAVGWDTRVLVYLRRQDHLLAASYAQFVKGSADAALDFDAFAREFAPRLDARALLRAWEGAFGRERILVRAYEPARLLGGIVPDLLTHVLGVAVPETASVAADDVEALNRSPGRDVIEYLRALHRRTRAGLPVPAREAVLEGALAFPPSGAAVAAWLSPAARRALLDRHAAGNAAIATDFLEPERRPLFQEPPPEDDASWSAYPGLTPERAAAIEEAVRRCAARRRPGVLRSLLRRLLGRPLRRLLRRLGAST